MKMNLKNGKRERNGILNDTNGDIYKGEFKNDKIQGITKAAELIWV